ncbi:MAG: hypothetical protein DRH21_02950 [Deltaproteobacteria bacterium]|nr:MAG: hypothetical protein DRH21_02950 [Deltaproteobacteria bacterium]
MNKTGSAYIKILFYICLLLFVSIIFVQKSYSSRSASLKDKGKIVQQMVREMRRSGESLPSEVAGELQKACKSR